MLFEEERAAQAVLTFLYTGHQEGEEVCPPSENVEYDTFSFVFSLVRLSSFPVFFFLFPSFYLFFSFFFFCSFFSDRGAGEWGV